MDGELKRLEQTCLSPTAELNALLESLGTAGVSTGVALQPTLARRPQVRTTPASRPSTCPGQTPLRRGDEAEISLRYEGYIKRQNRRRWRNFPRNPAHTRTRTTTKLACLPPGARKN